MSSSIDNDQRWQRFFALAGLVFIVLCLVGLEICWPQPPAFTISAVDTAHYYAGHQTGFLIGVTLCELSMAAYVLWTIQLGVMLWRLDDGAKIKTIAATACGITTPILLAGDLTIFAVTAYRPSQINPEITTTLSDIAWIGSELFWPILATEMALIAVIMLRSTGRPGSFPRWLGWYTVIAAIAEPGQAAIIFTKRGPLAPNGLFTWYAAVGTWGFWAIATSIVMYQVLGRNEIMRTTTPAIRDESTRSVLP